MRAARMVICQLRLGVIHKFSRYSEFDGERNGEQQPTPGQQVFLPPVLNMRAINHNLTTRVSALFVM